MNLTRREMLDDLQGKICRTCKGSKKPKQSHCSSCYFQLPRPMQLKLYRRFGEGYEEAYQASVDWLEENPR